MKKIIIIAFATLSTGIVLSSNLKKDNTLVKAAPGLNIKKSTINVSETKAGKPSYDVVATAD
ncbi:hypothetical protein [Mucilaginibacter paludis]|uniref:Uncharacterized protein n=1 Tax=Mucilaginibacter paludis DSM 18603 TaxID=714943 RepID=H1YCK9_9SPHI|nr:hypothetical protein [Mucilaginibacter paludis]EHQ30687.1 hypothetical protein Mucpa_6636 [Mucilaginibacter paludis DSM 18603]